MSDSRSNVRQGSVRRVLSCLSANDPTLHPFGPALQVLLSFLAFTAWHMLLSSLLTLVPLLYLHLVSLRIFTHSGLTLRVFVG